MKIKMLFILLSISSFVFTACNKKDDGSKSYPLQIKLTDAAGNYEEVNIDLQRIEVHTDEGGWQTLNTHQGIYDLTKLTNGTDTLIVNDTIPYGKISQIRLILGENNTVKVDGQIFDLKTPSAQQSGLKLNVHETLTQGVTYSILLDFDAAKSIVETGGGNYILKPVIRTITNATSGAIKGMVSPVASKPAVIAVMGTDSFGTYADANGYYLIRGIAAGTYSVYFNPANPYNDKTINSVGVLIGNVTDMGTVTIQ